MYSATIHISATQQAQTAPDRKLTCNAITGLEWILPCFVKPEEFTQIPYILPTHMTSGMQLVQGCNSAQCSKLETAVRNCTQLY